MRLDSCLVLVPGVESFVRTFWLGRTLVERVDMPRHNGRDRGIRIR
jgi:hypothetical protein